MPNQNVAFQFPSTQPQTKDRLTRAAEILANVTVQLQQALSVLQTANGNGPHPKTIVPPAMPHAGTQGQQEAIKLSDSQRRAVMSIVAEHAVPDQHAWGVEVREFAPGIEVQLNPPPHAAWAGTKLFYVGPRGGVVRK